jgi:hypothetical protein
VQDSSGQIIKNLGMFWVGITYSGITKYISVLLNPGGKL